MKINKWLPKLMVITLPIGFMSSCNAQQEPTLVDTTCIYMVGDIAVKVGQEYQYRLMQSNNYLENSNFTWSVETPTEHYKGTATITSDGKLKFSSPGIVQIKAVSKNEERVIIYDVTGLDVDDHDTDGLIAFSNDTWANVCSYANKGLAALKSHYNITGETGLLGAERIILLNGLPHRVRVIGEHHDHDQYNKIITLTFQMVTVVSDKNGQPLQTRYVSHDQQFSSVYPYISTMYKNLNETIENVEWHENASQCVSKNYQTSCYNMLIKENPELDGQIRYAEKEVATNVGRKEGAWVTSKYNATLFPLTLNESAFFELPSGSMEEGTTYAYWLKHTKNYERPFYALNGKAVTYPLVSPNCSDANYVWSIDNRGYEQWRSIEAAGLTCVNFAFSIGYEPSNN